MSGGGSGGGGTSNTTTQLPKWLTPYAKAFIRSYAGQVFGPEAAAAIAGSFGGTGKGNGKWGGEPTDILSPIDRPSSLDQQVAGFTQDQLAAMQGIRDTTGSAQNLANQGMWQASDTLMGRYLDPASNPWLSATYEQASRPMVSQYANAIAPGIMAEAGRRGMMGSSAMDETLASSRDALGTNLSDLATNIYGGNYQAERGRQLQQMQLLPGTMAAGYYPQNALMGVGALGQQQQQSEYDTSYQNAVGKAEWPFNLLSGFGGALGQAGGGGGTSTTTTSGGGGK